MEMNILINEIAYRAQRRDDLPVIDPGLMSIT